MAFAMPSAHGFVHVPRKAVAASGKSQAQTQADIHCPLLSKEIETGQQ